MKKGDIVVGKVKSVAFPNKGIAEVIPEDGAETVKQDGVAEESFGETAKRECVRVKGALPGQTVKMRIKKMNHGNPEGILLEVLEKSPMETEPDCPHFEFCGGCSYRTLPYEEQLHLKEMQVINLLRPVVERRLELKNASDDAASMGQSIPAVHFDDIYEGINPSPVQYGYRNKMEFSFGDEYKDGPLALGLHKRGSMYDIVNVTDCQIVDEDYRAILKYTLEFFESRNVPYFHKVQHTGYLRHLLVRKSVKFGEILVALVTTSHIIGTTEAQNDEPEGYTLNTSNDSKNAVNSEDKLLGEYVKGLLNLKLTGCLTGVVHTVNDSVADVVKDEGSEVLYGIPYIREELLGLQFKISQFSFFQTNSLGAEVLYGKVREFLLGDGEDDGAKKPSVIYDLYSGTGTIAQLMAPVAEKVVGVEIVEEAVEAAKENAALNGLENCDFIAGDVLKVLDDLTEKPDLIILDPPRDGIHPKALPKIIGYGVEKMVYVSCKPTSLARDLEVFMANGYQPTRICTVDMFPGTVHVETVILLTHTKS